MDLADGAKQRKTPRLGAAVIGSQRNQQHAMLRNAGISLNQAKHLAEGAGLTNVNSKSDIKAIIKAHDDSQVSHKEMENFMGQYSSKDKDKEEDKEPFVPREKTEDHLAAEEAYNSHYNNGSPSASTSAVDSYNAAFDNATALGRDITASDYLMQRADDKKGGVNRFMGYLSDKNTLARHETQHAASNFIDKIVDIGIKPPELSDPYDLYKKYRSDILKIGD